MREIIRKILREEISNDAKKYLLDMGPLEAQKFGMTTDYYITIAHDNDIVSYMESVAYPMLYLTAYKGGLYMYNNSGPFQGTVFNLEHRRNGQPVAIIPMSKYNILIKYMTEDHIIEFINEYYDLPVERIIKGRETNFG